MNNYKHLIANLSIDTLHYLIVLLETDWDLEVREALLEAMEFFSNYPQHLEYYEYSETDVCCTARQKIREYGYKHVKTLIEVLAGEDREAFLNEYRILRQQKNIKYPAYPGEYSLLIDGVSTSIRYWTVCNRFVLGEGIEELYMESNSPTVIELFKGDSLMYKFNCEHTRYRGRKVKFSKLKDYLFQLGDKET